MSPTDPMQPIEDAIRATELRRAALRDAIKTVIDLTLILHNGTLDWPEVRRPEMLSSGMSVVTDATGTYSRLIYHEMYQQALKMEVNLNQIEQKYFRPVLDRNK